MKKIAITGNIASGKSTVENMLKANNFIVIDTDEISHQLLESDEKIIQKIKSVFTGFDILDGKSNISRKKLGEIIFSNPKLKKELEEIIHPKIKEKLNEFYKQHLEQKVIFAAVPLLFEAGFEKDFDEILLITSDENTRLERLIKRNNFTPEHARARINSQLSQEKKIQLAHYTISNGSDLKSLEEKVQKFINEII